jgi:hypothetical protein
MADTVTSGGKTWLGVCVSMAPGFSFWHCLSLTGQTAETVLRTLHGVCEILRKKGFVICSIVTDNTRNEIAAVRAFSTQLRFTVFRVPCISCTTTLVIKHFLKEAFLSVPGRNFLDRMTDSGNLLPHNSQRDAFHGTPRPCDLRWTS